MSEDKYNNEETKAKINSVKEDNYYEEILDEENDTIKNVKPEVKQLILEVAGSKQSKLILGIILGMVVCYAIYQIIFSSSENDQSNIAKSEIDAKVEIKKPVELQDDLKFEPKLPILPDISNLDLPPLPIKKEESLKSQLPPLPILKETKQEIRNDYLLSAPNEAKAQRLKSNIALINGGKTPDADYDGTSSGPNSIPLTSKRVTATRIGDLKTVVAQGKMIDAILETSINSDLPGMVRGVVSQDVFSEAGSNILIPKGSRVIGEYKSGIALGQQRIEINWTRLIRPDGIDINLESKSTDPLGNSGVQGIVDNKYLLMFTNSMLSSIVNLGVARWKDIRDKKDGLAVGGSKKKITRQIYDKYGNNIGVEDVLDKDGKIQYEEEGSNVSQAMKKAGDDIGKIASDIVKKQIEAIKPTIVLHQGARIKIFVGSDLVFPNIGTSGVRIIR